MRMWFVILLGSSACSAAPATSGADDPAPEARCGPSADRGLDVDMCSLDFTLPDRSGEPFTLSSLRGKVALVDISALW